MDTRRLVLRAGAVAAMGGGALLAASSVASAANAGTAELDNWSPPFVTNNNHPHLNCSFAVQLFGFDMGTDKGNTAQVTFTGQAPTGKDVPIPITLGPSGVFSFPDAGAAVDAGKIVNAPRGTGWAQHFELDTAVLGAPQPNQGYHVSVDAVVNGSTLKQKTVWVQPCGAPAGPNVGIEKVGPADGIPGGQGTYDVTATNDGDVDALNQTITDTLPAGETFVSAAGATCTATNVAGGGQTVSCPIGTLAAHSAKTVHVVVGYDAALADLSQLEDCATVTGSLDEDCVTTTMHTPKVHLTKTGPATGIPGGQGTYDLKATNGGSADAVNQTITDTLPAGETFVSASGATCTATNIVGGGQTVSCPIGTLPAGGGSQTVHVVVQYAANLADGASLKDCATVTGSSDNPCATTVLHKPGLVVAKTGPATGTPNGNGTYTIVATNNGGADSAATTFTDTLPAGETFVSSTGPGNCSAAGQVVTCQLGPLAKSGGSATYKITVAYTARGDLTDCATIGGQLVASCVTTHIPGQPNLTVVKTNDADADGIFHDTETAAHPGDAVTFKVVVTNNSPDPIALDTITDAFSASTLAECPSLINAVLDSGDSVSCTFTIANYAPAAGSSLTDTVTVGGHQVAGGTPVSGSDTSTVKTRQPPTPGPDLAIVKNADQAKVKSGDTLTYTLTVANVGDGPTTGTTTVTDTVPDGLDLVSVNAGSGWSCSTSGNQITCTYAGIVAVGQTLPDITVVTTVNDSAVGSVINTGVVDTPGDTNPLNDRSTVKTPVTKVLPEKITKPNTPTQVLPFTGDRTGSMLPVGLMAMLLGLMLVVAGRRRRTA